MSAQENILIVQEWITAVNSHDADRVAATLAQDFVWELGQSTTAGRDVSREAWDGWFTAFPDFHFEILQMIADGDYIVTRLLMTGTHNGEWRFRGTNSLTEPIAATHRKFNLPGCAIHQIQAGNITHLWAYWDTATLLRQIGILPPSNT